jgi:transcriptional regulator with XRE-family HTH domain
MAARGVPKSTVNGWYRDRARTGHPEKAGRIGRTDYWFEDEWTAWHSAHRRRKLESLTQVDRSGAPDDLVDATEAARMLRYSGRDVIHGNRRLGYFPEPDAVGSTGKGRLAPLWKRSTVWATADRRPGMGGGHRPGTPGAPAKPHPYAGDERLAQVVAAYRSGGTPAASALAAEWRVSQRTAERILRAARAVLREEAADLLERARGDSNTLMSSATTSRFNPVGQAATCSANPGSRPSEGHPVMVPAPPIRRRLVGRTLRRYRESLGYTLEDAARVLECDRSKISRIETGQRGIRPKELRELLAEYGINGRQQSVLTVLADPRGAFGWPRDYADVLPAAWHDFLILETAATSISGYEAQQIPGLLQTRAYARALAANDRSLDGEAARDKAAEAVQARHQAILEDEERPSVHLVVGEAALHQQIGSQAVMREQLSVLASAAGDSGKATIQVMPFNSGAHAATGEGSLAIAQFAGAPGLGLVHVGGIGGGVCLEGRDDLAAYVAAFDQLRAFALTPVQSRRLLRGLARD